MEKYAKKTKAHTRYYLRDNTLVPGVTTITKLIVNKDALINWAYQCGLKGIDPAKYRDEKSDAGSLAHAMILAHLKGEEVDTTEYSQHVIDLAENSFLSYLEWEKGHKIEVIFAEEPLVSEKYRYGGTPDLFCNLDGIPTLVDYKTGKDIYDEHYLQVAAYKQLLIENKIGFPERCMIINIPRTEDERFRVEFVADTENYWLQFYHLLMYYWAKRRRR